MMLPGFDPVCGEVVRLCHDRLGVWYQRCVLVHGHESEHFTDGRWHEMGETA